MYKSVLPVSDNVTGADAGDEATVPAPELLELVVECEPQPAAASITTNAAISLPNRNDTW